MENTFFVIFFYILLFFFVEPYLCRGLVENGREHDDDSIRAQCPGNIKRDLVDRGF
jgi:hypothetical protein